MFIDYALMAYEVKNLLEEVFVDKNGNKVQISEQSKAQDNTRVTFFISNFKVTDRSGGFTFVDGKGEVGILQNTRIEYGVEASLGEYRPDSETSLRITNDYESRAFRVKEGYAVKSVCAFTFSMIIPPTSEAPDDVAEIRGDLTENSVDYEINIKKEAV